MCANRREVRLNSSGMSQHPPGIREATAAFEIEERRAGIRALVGMTGDLDFAAAPQLGDAIDRLLEARAHELWIDLRGLESIDSTGLAALIGARKRAVFAGAKFRLVVEGGPVRDVLELGRMDRVFQLATEPPRILR
jgi:anti-sigma B factor antagonist